MAYGGVAKAHYESMYKHLGNSAKSLLSESNEVEEEYKEEVSSFNNNKN